MALSYLSIILQQFILAMYSNDIQNVLLQNHLARSLASENILHRNQNRIIEEGTHKFKGLSQTSLWKYRVMAISNSPQPASDNSKGGASMTLVGLLKLE